MFSWPGGPPKLTSTPQMRRNVARTALAAVVATAILCIGPGAHKIERGTGESVENARVPCEG